MEEIIFHLSCPDQRGIIAQFTQLLHQHQVNILTLEQHVEPGKKLFFMRVHADLRDMSIPPETLSKLLKELKQRLNAELHIHDPLHKSKVAILCTTESAPVMDLLMKQQWGELSCEFPLIISNHESLKAVTQNYPVEYHFLPVTKENKKEQQAAVRTLLNEHAIDLVVLARYMQILSPDFVAEYSGKIINIHHGFLPAFKGDRPYHKAWERGVKIIGATAHYVTEELDEGPIIGQDVVSVSHQHSVNEMIQAGRDIERRVLTSAVKAHLEHRIILHGQRTLIFHA